MTKIVRKLRPTDYWRIGEHESWFSDMSAKGLHLNKMGIHFAHFEKGEPEEIEYRIEVTDVKSINDEQIDLYEDNGWYYITSYQYFHVFAAPKQAAAVEIHTDPAEQSFTLTQLNKKLIANSIFIFIGAALFVGMLASIWLLDGTPILRLVEGIVIQQTILALLLLYYIYVAIRAMLAIQALRKSLKSGKAIDHHARWEKSLHKNKALSMSIVGIALISAVLPWMQLVKSDTVTLPEGATDYPIVRLADLEQNPQLVRDEYFIGDEDWGNRISTNWSIFAPVQYETEENGTVKGKTLEDYMPSVSSEIYELTFQSFAQPLVKDLIKWHTLMDEQYVFVEREHPSFDQLQVNDVGYFKQLVASKGKVVMYVAYNGEATLDTVIELVAQKIER